MTIAVLLQYYCHALAPQVLEHGSTAVVLQ